MQRDAYMIVKRPRITEKATDLTESANAWTFVVARDANKVEIKKAIESLYGVKVKKVHTMRMKGKWRRVGRSFGRTPDWKKAIVTLAEGASLDLL